MNKLSMTSVLLESHANADLKDNDGRTPLHHAVENGSLEVVRLLLEHGCTVDAKDNSGLTPFASMVAPKQRNRLRRRSQKMNAIMSLLQASVDQG
jgi:ankyrin repeat protein